MQKTMHSTIQIFMESYIKNHAAIRQDTRRQSMYRTSLHITAAGILAILWM